MNESAYILRALDSDGNESFYTGRTGDGWVSSRRDEAFVYQSPEGARRKATQFNAYTQLHGLRFIALTEKFVCSACGIAHKYNGGECAERTL